MTSEMNIGATPVSKENREPGLDDVLEGVRSVFEQVLGRSVPDLDKGLRAMGGDSIALIHILSGLMDKYGVMPEIADPAAEQSVAGVAGRLLSILGDSSGAIERKTLATLPDHDAVVPLMPNRLSYFIRRRRGLLQWTLATPVLKFAEGARESQLRTTFANLMRRHDSLRLSLHESRDGALVQRVLDERELGDIVASFPLRSLDRDGHVEIEAALRSVEQSMQYGGALVRLALFGEDTDVKAFAIVIHHLCVDYLSFCRVIEEFLAEYDAVRRGLPNPVKPAVSSYAFFVDAFMRHQSEAAKQSQAYWMSLPWHDWRPMMPSFDASHPLNVEEKTTECSASAPMHEDRDSAGYSLAGRVLAATAIAFREWTGGNVLLIDMVFHGREQFNPSLDTGSLVGWMSEVRPIVLDARQGEMAILQEAERQLSWLGSHGGSHGYLRHVDTDPARDELRRMPQPEISLNLLAPSLPGKRYLGVCEPLWPRVAVSPPPHDAQRAYLISGGCKVANGELVLSWDFSGDLIGTSEVDGFTRACVERFTALNRLIARCENGIGDETA